MGKKNLAKVQSGIMFTHLIYFRIHGNINNVTSGKKIFYTIYLI